MAAIKHFVANQGRYFSNLGLEQSAYLDDKNVDALAISDYMHLETEQGKYNQDVGRFQETIETVLHNKPKLSFRHVQTNDDTVLRLLQVKQRNSDNLSDALLRNKPVIYSRGLWSNLFSWKDFALEMADTGREGWLIEVTGGPNLECDTCKDYTYNDLKDDYWPASVSAALSYSERDGVLKANPSLDKADYVGFSNGCRVGLDALKDHGSGYSNNWKITNESGSFIVDTSLPASPIDTFVGVGCPGAFEGSSLAKTGLNLFGKSTINTFRAKNIDHATVAQFIKAGVFDITPYPFQFLVDPSSNSSDSKISINLFNKYVDLASKTTDIQPGNINVNKAAIIEGRFLGQYGSYILRLARLPPIKAGDLAVTIEDQTAIYNNINASSKKRFAVNRFHVGLPDDLLVGHFIRKTLNNESLTLFEKIAFLAEEA